MGAKLVAVMLALATVASPLAAHADDTHAADPAARDKSRAAFRRGVGQLRAQDWKGARASFEEAWSLVQHPSILLNLGIARLRTDDPVLAESDLVRFLNEDSGAAPEELASAREALAEARTKIGTLWIRAQPESAQVAVDGKPVTSTTGVVEARLKVGKHTVTVQADGYKTDERMLAVTAKGDAEIQIALVAADAPKAAEPVPTKPSEPSSTRRIVGWSLAGVSVVAFAAGGVMALHASSLASDYGDRTSGSFQDPSVKDEGIAFRSGADVGLVVGLLAGTGAAILLFTNLGRSRAADVLRQPLVRF